MEGKSIVNWKKRDLDDCVEYYSIVEGHIWPLLRHYIPI